MNINRQLPVSGSELLLTPDVGASCQACSERHYSTGQDRHDFYRFAARLHVDAQCFGLSIDDLMDKFSDKHFRAEHPEYRDVYPEECSAIYMHTAQDYSSHLVRGGIGTPLYREVNNYLRLQHENSGRDAGIDNHDEKLSPHIKMLSSALNRLMDVAAFRGTVYRGIRGDLDTIARLYHLFDTGGRYVEPAFMSTTRIKDSAQVFEPGTPNNIAFQISLKRGADISGSSQAPSEEEIMLPIMSEFVIEHASALFEGKHLFVLSQI
ncbi:hypothetical protein KDX38_28765 [Pseudomonas sp. CDFA 602]|uniref:ADP-ribosyltransferase n=1 Tax=Pseudomonas californiensis TaxID=2829823 RepID=UPI001E39ADB5|nr:ADP-ribosyltransferase [Pseudomonas californiensis]MCD5997530.1 hypothetical protein [Pseudomonas californiensis]MCD6003136.1 hypothetical protein [Pseudomonas californiensis]